MYTMEKIQIVIKFAYLEVSVVVVVNSDVALAEPHHSN